MEVIVRYNKSNCGYIKTVRMCCDRLSSALFDVAGQTEIKLILDTDEDAQLRVFQKGEFVMVVRRCLYCGEEIKRTIDMDKTK